MADAVASQVVFDGSKTAVMKFTNISDGSGESAVIKVDVSALAAYQGTPCSSVNIVRLDAMTVGMGVDILVGATAGDRYTVVLEMTKNYG